MRVQASVTIVAWLLMLVSTSVIRAQASTITFAFSEDNLGTPMAVFYIAKYTEAFRRLGMVFKAD